MCIGSRLGPRRPGFLRWIAPSVLLFFAGCSGPEIQGPELHASDFTDPGAEARPRQVEPPSTSVTDSRTARAGVGDVMVITGAPAIPATGTPVVPPVTAPVEPLVTENGTGAQAPAMPIATAERELQVDQLVGQVNGRPVYANEFFEPMDERLRREATQLTPRAWLAMARKDIEAALWDKLRDELLLAEFQGALSEEQRQGIFSFIDQIRNDLVSGNLGSPELAKQRLIETEGLDLEQKVEDVTQREFIAFQLKKAIGDRVNVAARDIELYYEQNIDQYVPAPVAKFVILRLPASDAPKLAAAEAALTTGEAFEPVAKRLSTWRPEKGNASEVTLTNQNYAETILFGPKPLNEAARALAPGGVSARTEFGGDMYWIKLAAIETMPGKSLYEAQREIERKLRAERAREEEIRYFEQLFRRGSFSDIKEMTKRLVEFSAERYLVLKDFRADQPPPAGSAPAQAPEK